MANFVIGPVEKSIYEARSRHPIVIPQIDPDEYTPTELMPVFKHFQSLDISHIAIGGSTVDPTKMQETVDMAVKDYGFYVITYLSNPSAGFLKGFKDKTAIYWASFFNTENQFFIKDSLVMASLFIKNKNLEPLPTAYVFDDRKYIGSATWITRATPVPREKPELSLAIAKAAEYLGIRFYIMAGGSGSPYCPPPSHITKLRKYSDLFLIPTSGIKTVDEVNLMFDSGADAIHVGQAIEQENGLNLLTKMVEASKKHKGKDFL